MPSAALIARPPGSVLPWQQRVAGKRQSGQVRKGNRHVRRILCAFAHAASRTTSVFMSKFQFLAVGRGYKRATIATGHKILRTPSSSCANDVNIVKRAWGHGNAEHRALMSIGCKSDGYTGGYGSRPHVAHSGKPRARTVSPH